MAEALFSCPWRDYFVKIHFSGVSYSQVDTRLRISSSLRSGTTTNYYSAALGISRAALCVVSIAVNSTAQARSRVAQGAALRPASVMQL